MKKNISVLLILFMIAGCVRGPGHGGQITSVHNGSSGTWSNNEALIGRQIHQQITSTFRMYTEPRLVGYVTRTGRSILLTTGQKGLPYLFTVLYDDRVYATSAPGGFIYITTGSLNFLQNEAELASVLAHEIAELQFHEPALSKSRRAIGVVAQTGAVAAPFLGPFGVLVAGALVLLNVAAEASVPTPLKRLVSADRLALQSLWRAGQDPQGYLDWLGRLLSGAQNPSPFLFDYFQSRPVSPERYQKAFAEFEKLPMTDKRFSVHRERYLEMTKGVRQMYAK